MRLLEEKYGELAIEKIFNSLEGDLLGGECKKELYKDGGSVEYIYSDYRVIQSNIIIDINNGVRTCYDVTRYIAPIDIEFSKLNEMAMESNLIDYFYKDLVLIDGNYDFIVKQRVQN